LFIGRVPSGSVTNRRQNSFPDEIKGAEARDEIVSFRNSGGGEAMSDSSQTVPPAPSADAKLIHENKLGKPLDFSFMGVKTVDSENKRLPLRGALRTRFG